jgi:hypothetical protein
MVDYTTTLRSKIEEQFGKISDELFLEVLQVAKNDVRANISRYGKRADYAYVYFVAECYLKMIIKQGIH